MKLKALSALSERLKRKKKQAGPPEFDLDSVPSPDQGNALLDGGLELPGLKIADSPASRAPAPETEVNGIGADPFAADIQQEQNAIAGVFPEDGKKKENDGEPLPGDEGRVALIREVFQARLHALAATYRLKLEYLESNLGDKAEKLLLRKQVRILHERTANLAASYQEALACHEDVIAFLGELSQGNLDNPAEPIRRALLHNAASGDAEAFLDKWSQNPGNGPERTARAAFLCGRLAEGRVDLRLAGARYARALRLAPDNIEFLRLGGQTAHHLGQYGHAARWQAHRVLLLQQGDNDKLTMALAWRDLAYTYLKARKFDEAAPLYKMAMTTLGGALGNNHPEMATAWFQLGEMQEIQGDMARAHELYQRALKILESSLGLLDSRLSPVLEKLAVLSMNIGQMQNAFTYYRKLVAVQEKYLPEDHPLLAGSLAVLAGLYRARNEYALAEQCVVKSLRINESMHGREHPVVAALLDELARLCTQQGKPEEATRYGSEAAEIRSALLKQEHGEQAAGTTAPPGQEQSARETSNL